LNLLYVSGETNDDVVRTGVLRDAVPFVQKPFAPEGIAHEVREILSSRELLPVRVSVCVSTRERNQFPSVLHRLLFASSRLPDPAGAFAPTEVGPPKRTSRSMNLPGCHGSGCARDRALGRLVRRIERRCGVDRNRTTRVDLPTSTRWKQAPRASRQFSWLFQRMSS